MVNLDSVNNFMGSAQAPNDSVRPQPALINSAQGSVTSMVVDGNLLPQSGKSAKVEAANQQPTGQDFEALVAQLSDFARAVERDLSFTVDENTGDTVIVVKDRQTDEVVRQMPSEVVLHLAQKMLHNFEDSEKARWT